MFEINYSQLIQYEILEKLVTSMDRASEFLQVYVCGFNNLTSVLKYLEKSFCKWITVFATGRDTFRACSLSTTKPMCLYIALANR